MILRIGQCLIRQALRLQPPIDIAVKGKSGRFGAIAFIVEIEGFETFKLQVGDRMADGRLVLFNRRYLRQSCYVTYARVLTQQRLR